MPWSLTSTSHPNALSSLPARGSAPSPASRTSQEEGARAREQSYRTLRGRIGYTKLSEVQQTKLLEQGDVKTKAHSTGPHPASGSQAGRPPCPPARRLSAVRPAAQASGPQLSHCPLARPAHLHCARMARRTRPVSRHDLGRRAAGPASGGNRTDSQPCWGPIHRPGDRDGNPAAWHSGAQ